MIRLTIDGHDVRADEGTTVLEAARSKGIEIPTLCHHEAVGGFGACRLCVVEVMRRASTERVEVITSCTLPVEEGLVVETGTERILGVRRLVLDLLAARCPQSDTIREMALEYGVKGTNFHRVEDRDNCILCGLCMRICEALGANAISTVGRGHAKEVAAPFGEPPEDCIGCGACAACCPTGNIYIEDRGRKRTIWGRTFGLVKCSGCGKLTITQEQAEFFAEKSGLGSDYFDLCEECNRKEAADTFREIMYE